MHISPIGLGYGNLRQNKIKKSNSKVISNPVESSDNTVKLSLEQLQKMNNISFKGDKAANSPNETEAVLNSPLLKTDEDGQTFFHKASVENLKARKQKITPQLLKIALSMQDNKGNTCLHYIKGPEFINIIVDILGDEAPETFAKICTIEGALGITLLDKHKRFPFSTIPYNGREVKELKGESKAIFKALGNKTAEVVKNYRGLCNETIFHYQLEPELAQIIVDNMGDKAPEVLSEMLPMQNNFNNTFLHREQYPETLEIYAKALKDKAPEVFAKACTTENTVGSTPIERLLNRYYNEALDITKAVFKALGNKTAEVVKNYRGSYGETIFHRQLEPELAQIIVDNMGDKAPEVLSEMLPMQGDLNYTFLYYNQYPETLKIYAKTLKDKAPETFAKAYYTKKIDKVNYSYYRRKLIQAIIAGEKV